VRRIILVLTAAALMVVLMATTVSPAFADAYWKDNPDEKWGYGGEEPRWTGKDGCTWGWGGRKDC
jgi:hypothetical protein